MAQQNTFHQNKQESKTLYLRWSKQEKIRYVDFLEQNLEIFLKTQARRGCKIFQKMADLFQNKRDNQQCRTFHVKSLAKFGSIEGIIENIRNPKVKQSIRSLKFSQNEQRILKKISLDHTTIQPEIQLEMVIDQQDPRKNLFEELCGPSFYFM